MFVIVDDDDGGRRRRTPEHGYTISSSCEPEGSGDLQMQSILNQGKGIRVEINIYC